jgi:hypothetical protein
MQTNKEGLKLTSLGLAGAALKVSYNNGNRGESVYEPDLVLVSHHGMFLQWPNCPDRLEKVNLEWSENPFMPHPFRSPCTVVERQSSGVEVAFDRPTPVALQDWFTAIAGKIDQRTPDAMLKTSKLYTTATVVSACGLLCGALAILLPILTGEHGWVDLLAKVLLVLMVVSIGGFAWIRALAGREEIRAIGQSRG